MSDLSDWLAPLRAEALSEILVGTLLDFAARVCASLGNLAKT